MIVHRMRHFCCVIFAFGLASSFSAYGHGGVVEEDDLCVIKVEFLKAHFKVYQPTVSGHKQFCEDLPVASESIFVMEYQHDALSTMPINFRIVRDVTGKGRFARMDDVNAIADLNAATVFYQEAIIDKDVYTVVHDFTEEGDFIGIVSASHPESGKVYAAVFPFEVGFTGVGYWPFIIGLALLIQLQFLVMSGRLRRWFGGNAASASVALVAMLLTTTAVAGDLVVTHTEPSGGLSINQMQSIVLHIETESGEPVLGAMVTVEGGMPAHDHGLPTRPRVTAEIGKGNYRLDGLRFHMSGYWELIVTVTTERESSTITVPLEL